MNAQEQLADAMVEGTAGGGLVKVTLDGQGEIVDVYISPDTIDASDPAECAQTLADLILAACRDASRAASELQEQMMGPLASMLGQAGGPGGIGMPGFPGMPPGAPRMIQAEADDADDDSEPGDR
jgi:DNA-binding YbaB/EbfC family protein